VVQEAFDTMWLLGRVVLVLVDAHQQGLDAALARARDDDILGAARGQVPLGLLGVGERGPSTRSR